MSTKRLRQRAHEQAPKDTERLTLAPLAQLPEGDSPAEEGCR